MPKRTLTQKIETAVQCHARASVHYFLVRENGTREEDKGQFYSEPDKPHLVIKGEMWGRLGNAVLGSASMQIAEQYANDLTLIE